MLQALYDDLYLLPIMKKNTPNVNDRAAKGRHSGLELMKNAKGHILVKIIEYVPRYWSHQDNHKKNYG